MMVMILMMCIDIWFSSLNVFVAATMNVDEAPNVSSHNSDNVTNDVISVQTSSTLTNDDAIQVKTNDHSNVVVEHAVSVSDVIGDVVGHVGSVIIPEKGFKKNVCLHTIILLSLIHI